ncbi:MAG: membrane protein insertion efficiency factor YidD [Candidatus Omnitrophica bacterium]|nr:membrane protein insertion efficiency factor YidD [Candidatus Omnitrophota bacterium]
MNRLALFLIGLYQRISFLFPSHCLYEPSCSQYARQAFLQYPFLKACMLSIARILRCNPFVRGGLDPLPTHHSRTSNGL